MHQIHQKHGVKLLTPSSLDEAVQEYASRPRAGIMAGGTDLMVLIKDRLATPEHLISLSGIEGLRRIRRTAERWEIGALAGLWELERNRELGRDFPALAQALNTMAAPPLRNAGTIGGNICLDLKCIYYNQSHRWQRSLADCLKAGGRVCHVAPAGKRCWGALAADTVGPLVVSGARVKLVSQYGQRTVPLEAFFSGDGLAPHDLRPGEILTQIHLALPKPDTGQAYQRFALRRAIDFSLLNLSASVTVDPAGKVVFLELILGAAGPRLVRLGESLAGLVGTDLNADILARTTAGLGREAVRISRSPRLTRHLQEVAGVLGSRVLTEAYRRAGGGSHA